MSVGVGAEGAVVSMGENTAAFEVLRWMPVCVQVIDVDPADASSL